MGKKSQAGLLASIALLVAPSPPWEWARTQAGRVLQAFLYDTLAVGNAPLADRLHAANALKPFTVSLPRRWRPAQGHTPSGHAAPMAAIRLTALTAEVYQALVEGLLRRCQASSLLSLGPYSVNIQQVLFTTEASPLAHVTSYEALYRGPLARTFRMRFLTPTSFRVGQGNLAFPLPASLYRSLWQKWQHFAPAAFHFDERVLAIVQRQLFPARYTLHTAVLRQTGGVAQVGCVGRCQFELLGAVSAEDQRAITALSRFAFYAGVGMKTTMGMGQTWVESGTPAEREETHQGAPTG